LNRKNYYPAPYNFIKDNAYKKKINNFYDYIKIKILRFIIPILLKKKTQIIFVSEWMKESFFECTKISPKLLDEKMSIIPNSIHSVFIKNQYDEKAQKEADFITIRPLDESKYGIDIVVDIAKQNPQ
jgi:hypothetical protein